MFDLTRLKEAIHREELGGWLFSSFKGRDSVSLSVLGVDPSAKNTRPWYYFAFSEAEPIAVVHAIEAMAVSHLPGERFTYASRVELENLLKTKILGRLNGKGLACQFSPELPVVSYLDHGTALFLESLGFALVSSASLIQRFVGLLDEKGVASHERSAAHLYEIVRIVWDRVRASFSSGKDLFEGEVRSWILDEFEHRGLTTDNLPIVAAGPAAGDPHYSLKGGGNKVNRNVVLQLDLWAKEKAEGAVFADISWVGFTGTRVPERIERDALALFAVRDGVLDFIKKHLPEGPLTGAEVDRRARSLLIEAGYEKALRHRTGHGIDTENHGSGVNLDSVEFPDFRNLLEGSCFSVEPGIYFDDYGLRTEMNVYIRKGIALVSGGPLQERFLTL